jgi:hypothetical protein
VADLVALALLAALVDVVDDAPLEPHAADTNTTTPRAPPNNHREHLGAGAASVLIPKDKLMERLPLRLGCRSCV